VLYLRNFTVCPTAIRYVRQLQIVVTKLELNFMKFGQLVQETKAGWNFIPPCIPDSHPHRITSTKCRINTVVSPDDGHIVARNM
jgi:hypothetical protein